MGVLELFICCHILGVWNFTIESHDGPEGIAFGNQTKFSRREVVVLTGTIHLLLSNGLQVIFLEVFNRHLHNKGPNCFSVVKDSAIFFLFLSTVKEAAQQTDNYFFEDPFEHLPENEFIFIAKEACILAFCAELKPADLVNFKAVEYRDPGEHLKPVKLHKLEDFFIENLFVLALHE